MRCTASRLAASIAASPNSPATSSASSASPAGRRHPVDVRHRHAAACQVGGEFGQADIDDADGRRQQAWRCWLNHVSGSNPLIDNRTIPIICREGVRSSGRGEASPSFTLCSDAEAPAMAKGVGCLADRTRGAWDDANATWHAPCHAAANMTRPPARSGTDRASAIYQALRRAIIEQALEPGRQTARGRHRRALRREPHAGAQCAGPPCRRRAGGAAPQPRRRRGKAELGGGARYLRRAPGTGAPGGLEPGWPVERGPGGAFAPPRQRRGGRARHQRAAVDPAGR